MLDDQKVFANPSDKSSHSRAAEEKCLPESEPLGEEGVELRQDCNKSIGTPSDLYMSIAFWRFLKYNLGIFISISFNSSIEVRSTRLTPEIPSLRKDSEYLLNPSDESMEQISSTFKDLKGTDSVEKDADEAPPECFDEEPEDNVVELTTSTDAELFSVVPEFISTKSEKNLTVDI